MTYKEATEYLFNRMPMFERQGASGYKEGLGNTLELDKHFNHPHKKYHTIHIAGTNGKGSCAHTIAAILQSYGYKTGLYTSPHLIDFKERIRINGCPISEQYVTSFVEHEHSFFEPLHPSFFEVTTALAFKYFADNDIDIAVIEVGLGGRLDCTNIITPILSTITNISFDHTQFLGNTLDKIAGEKAGIIKCGTPVVIGESNTETRSVFEKAAMMKSAPIIFAEEEPEIIKVKRNITAGITYETNDYGIINGHLCGDYQIKNTNTILHMVKQLERIGIFNDTSKLKESIRDGFENVCKITGLMGRWQIISKKPLVICDAGHNPGGWKYIGEQLKHLEYENLHIIFGMVNDKDTDSVLTYMPQKAIYYFTKPESKRARSEHSISEAANKIGLKGDCYPNVREAYRKAMQNASAKDAVFIGGSCYLIADFLKCIL